MTKLKYLKNKYKDDGKASITIASIWSAVCGEFVDVLYRKYAFHCDECGKETTDYEWYPCCCRECDQNYWNHR